MLPTIPSISEEQNQYRQVTYNLNLIDNFPVTQFEANKTKYSLYESWYNGSALEEIQTQQGKKVDKYPVRINPFKNLVSKHVSALFGETTEDERPLVIPRIFAKKEKKEEAKKIEEILNTIWYENNGRALQLENGFISQIYGGCIFKVIYVPWETWRKYPIRIEKIRPATFICRPDFSDSWRLREAWIVEEVSNYEAKNYGVTLGENEIGIKVEYWSTSKHKVTINGIVCSKMLADGTVYKFDNVNIYGEVPIVYIPHVRTNYFYGESLIEPLIGLVEEQNLRMADYGDAISDDAHRYIAMRNVNGSPNTVKLSNGLNVINLGSSQSGLTNTSDEPDMFEVNKGSASAPMSDINEKLLAQIRRDSFVPAIADGEDEGSQRSALTLAMRMWPLTSHIRHERINWSTGLNLLHHFVLLILYIKKLAQVTEEDLQFKFRYTWSPSLPKDRDSLVTEAVSLGGSNLGSPQSLIGKLGDVDDVEEEMENIIAWVEKIAEAQAKSMPVFGGGSGSNDGGKNVATRTGTNKAPNNFPPKKSTDGGK